MLIRYASPQTADWRLATGIWRFVLRTSYFVLINYLYDTLINSA